MILWDYWRSTAAYRVRIALNLKGLEYESAALDLRAKEHHTEAYRAVNPMRTVPTVEDGGVRLFESMAICEWLEETHPEPKLLPGDALQRARVRGFALAIACDIHPVQNLKVLNRLRSLALPEAEVTGWARWVIGDGLAACQALLAGASGPFCFGPAPTLADICLVPQLFNARRFGVELQGLPRLLAAEAACNALPAFADAAPERQADAE